MMTVIPEAAGIASFSKAVTLPIADTDRSATIVRTMYRPGSNIISTLL
jgi:hypothetical protein